MHTLWEFIAFWWRCLLEGVSLGKTPLVSAKEILLELAEKLPPDATLRDAIYELALRQAVQQGLDELNRGEAIPIEQIAAWAGK
jgi:hypothetical protein